MSHGLPDYYRGVDIAYQALSEMINRPKYGGAQLGSAIVTVVSQQENALLSVSGKGMIYGGLLWLAGDTFEEGSYPRLYVDDELMTDKNFSELKHWGCDREHIMPIYLVYYNDVDHEWAVAFSHGITFEEGFDVKYLQFWPGNTPTVYVTILYALV